MGINPQYQPIYNQAKDLQYKFHDFLGQTNPTAHVLHSEMKSLVNDIELGKNPRDIENRIRVVQNQMAQVQHQGQPLMSYEHADYFHHNFEQMRQQVRHFGNYN